MGNTHAGSVHRLSEEVDREAAATVCTEAVDDIATVVSETIDTQLEGAPSMLESVCRDYFESVIETGPPALGSLRQELASTAVDPSSVRTAIAAVQSRLVASAASVLEGDGDISPTQLAAFTRVVTQDVHVLTPTTEVDTSSRPRQLREQIEAIAERAEEINESSFEIETLTKQQSDNTEHIASEIADVSAGVDDIVSTATTVSERSDEARALADDGSQQAHRIANRIERVREGNVAVLETMTDLDERTDEIDRVVEVLNDIADQTNLIAINASIEAARAGEGGARFAIVADEVKSLAEQSKTHAEEIESLVRAVQKRTQESRSELEEVKAEATAGSTEVDEAVQTFDEIAHLSAEVADGLDEIENATDQQASSVEMLSMMIDEAASKATRISSEVAEINDANETQQEALETVQARLE